MPQIDVLEEAFVAAAPPRVAAWVRRSHPAMWPGLALTVGEERGDEGQRYLVTGEWAGSAEIWLEPCLDGVRMHAYLRLDRTAGPVPARRAAAETRRRRRAVRRALHAAKDILEDGRPPGSPATGGTGHGPGGTR